MLKNQVLKLYHTIDTSIMHIWMMRLSKIMTVISAMTLLMCHMFMLGEMYELEFGAFTLLFLWSYLYWREIE